MAKRVKKLKSFGSQQGAETIRLMGELYDYARQYARELRSSGSSYFSEGVSSMDRYVWERIQECRYIELMRYQKMEENPLLARFTLRNDDGLKENYYVAPAAYGQNVASYRSPVGRLAEYAVGNRVVLNGKCYKVIDRQIIGRCQYCHEQWDGIKVQAYEFKDVTFIPSIQRYIMDLDKEEAKKQGRTKKGKEAEREAERAKEYLEEEDSEDVVESEKISKVEKSLKTVDLFASINGSIEISEEEQFGLRWQSILDKTQGEIFRKPLDSRIVLLGPPGTGKTTTLVKRLYQKLDYDDDPEEEVNIFRYRDIPPQKDWLVFTPTELLRLSLKNAVNKEGVPADNNTVRTWDEYRQQVARDDLQLLKTARRDGFLLTDDESFLKESCFSNNLGWTEDFVTWRKNKFLKDLYVFLKDTIKLGAVEYYEVASQVSEMIEEKSTSKIYEVLKAIEDVQNLMEEDQKKYKDQLKGVINKTFNFLNNLSKEKFLKDWKKLVRSSLPAAQPVDDGKEVDVLDQETKVITEGSAVATLSRLIQERFVSEITNKPLSKRNAELLKLLKELPYLKELKKPSYWKNLKKPSYWKYWVLTPEEAQEIAKKILLMRRYRYLANLLQKYLDGYFRSYIEFREIRQRQRRWYVNRKIVEKKISPHECDMLLATCFGDCDELLAYARTYVESEEKPFWRPLRRFTNLQKMQILIDEVTDFSPNQLRCMYFLARENARSIFACGDLNQRMTTFGVKDKEALKLTLDATDTREIRTAYRQSVSLHAFTRAIIHGTKESVLSKISKKNIGLKPALAEKTRSTKNSVKEICRWIRQIDAITQTPIAIAVFVPSEKYVGDVADMMKKDLQGINLNVIACREGNSIGRGGAVRVFAIQHIKGLEFDAAFFFDLDCMKKYKKLFNKVLYVGATRARSFLGITCKGMLPQEISYLREEFVEAWDQ